MIDYPAAHSMDTGWFAVDADGNIGLFDSGEGGAVPESNEQVWQKAQKIWGSYRSIEYFDGVLSTWAKESSDRIIDIALPSEAIMAGFGLDIEDLDINKIDIGSLSSNFIHLPIQPTIENAETDDDEIEDWEWIDSHWLLFPADNPEEVLDILKAECLEDRGKRKCIVRFCGEIPMILGILSSRKTVNHLIQKRLVRYVIHIKAESEGLAILLGLFYYSQEEHAAFPYECAGRPFYALNLTALPENYQQLFAQNSFKNIKFSENRKIQPIEHMPCDTWGDDKWWVDAQGNEREGHPDYSSL